MNKDGTHTIYYLNEAVKFIDKNGIIKEKDISLFPNLKGYSTFRNNIDLLLPYKLSDGISANYEGYKVTLTPSVISPVIIGVKQDNSVVYESTFGTNTALKYTPTLSGLKEDIILSEYNENIPTSYSFTLDTDGLSVYNDSNGYYLAESKDGKKIFNLGNVLVYDAMGKPEDGTMSVTTVTEGEKYTLTLSVSESFLTDPETVYPVTVDPTLTVSDAVTSVGAIEDAPIYEGKPDNRFGSYIYNRVGLASEAYGVGRTVMRLPGLVNSPEFQSIVDVNQVQSVTLNVIETSGGASQAVSVYPVLNTSWTESTVTWNNLGSWDSVTGGTGTLTSRSLSSINIRRMVTAWIAGVFDPAGGFLIKSNNETVNKSFYSSEAATDSNKPYVVMTYLPKGNGGGDDFEDATSLQAAVSNSVTMNYRNEKRYFSFIPSTDGFYTFASTSSSCNANIQLYNSDEVLIAQNGITSGATETSSDFELTYHLCANVEYYIAVGCAETSGSYTFELTAEDDPGRADNINFELNIQQTGSSDTAYKTQCYAFTPGDDGFYTFSVATPSFSAKVWLYNELGQALMFNDTVHNNGNLNFQYFFIGSTVYYLVIQSNNINGNLYSANINKTQNLSLAVTEYILSYASGSCTTSNGYEFDFYKFTSPDSAFYVAESLNCIGDPVVWLYNQNGELLGFQDNYNGSLPFSLSYHFTSGQTYYFVFGFYGSSCGNYSIMITKPSSVETDTQVAVAGAGVNIDVSCKNDIDVVEFTPMVNNEYLFVSSKLQNYAYIWVYNSNAENVCNDYDNVGLRALAELVANQKYYIVISQINNTTVNFTLNILSTANLTNNIYYIKNAGSNMYMDIEGPGPQEWVQQWTSHSGTQERWLISKQNNGFYTIKSQYGNNYYVGISSNLTETNNVKLYSNTNYDIYWRIFEGKPGEFFLEPAYDEGVILYAHNNNLGSNLRLTDYANSNLDGAKWNILNVGNYFAKIVNYIDYGYCVNYDETLNESIEVVYQYTDVLADRFFELLGVRILFDSGTYFESPIDECKGTVTSANINTLCTHSGTIHTDRDNVISSFESSYTAEEMTTYVLWSNHKIRSIATSGNEEYNRSCSSGSSILMLERSDDESRYTDSIGVLMHEICHQFGAQDHYHEEIDENGTCKFGDVCSDCGEKPRPDTCIMYQSRTDISRGNILCDECKEEILVYLAEHYLYD